MIPHERAMVKKLEGRPFVLVSVSADDDVATLKADGRPWDGPGGPPPTPPGWRH